MKQYSKLALAGVSLFALSEAASAQMIDYGLTEDMFGEPVTTSATGKPQRKSDVPLNMEIITQDQIVKSGARDIPQVLRRFAGMSVRENSIGYTEVGIRGYNQTYSERILVLVNGRQVYQDYFGLVLWDLISVELSEIRQIEIVRGPNTALFGFNAVSGVINIVTDNPLFDQKTTVTAAFGTENQVHGSFTSTFKVNERLGIRFSAGLSEADEFDTQGPVPFNDRDLIIARPHRRHISSELYFQATDKVQVTLEGAYSDILHNGFSPLRLEAIIESKLSTLRGRVIADTDIGQINFNAYINDTSPFNTTLGGTLANQTVDGLRPLNKVKIFQLSDIFKIGTDHTIRLSTEFRNSQFRLQGTDRQPVDGDGLLQYDIYSVAGLWDWAISEKLNFSTAVRYDQLELSRTGGLPAGVPFTNAAYDQTIKEVGLNAGLVWKPTGVDTLRFTIARGVDIPSLVEFGILLPVAPSPFNGSVFVTGDPATDASSVWNYEVDWDRRIDSLHSTFRLAAFYQDIKNQQSFSASTTVAPPNIFSNLGNVGDSEAYGFELSLQGEKDDTYWNINYSYIDVNDDLLVNQGPVIQSPYFAEGEVSHHTFNVNVGHKWGKFSADTLLHYTSGYETTRNLQTGPLQVLSIDGNFRADLRLAYALTEKVSLELVGQSIFDKEFVESSQAPVKRQVFVRLQAKF